MSTQAKPSEIHYPQPGDNFWVRVDGRVYFGEITGTTPGGRRFVLGFHTQVPKISGKRKRQLNVLAEQLVENPKKNVRWELLVASRREAEQKAQLRLV